MIVATRAQIVTFRLAEDLFAADISEVERVLRYAPPTPVPNVPEWVKGVIEYRSRVVPVIDLRERFELPAAPVNGATRLMILSSNGDWVAAVVDAVLEVVALGNAQLAGPPALFRGLAGEFLRGILRRKERLIIVLDVTRLLATHERLTFDTGGESAADAIAALAAAAATPEIDHAAGGEEGVLANAPERDPRIAGLLTDSASPDQGTEAEQAPVGQSLPGMKAPEPAAPGAPEPTDGGPLNLLSTSDEAPRPDQSILGLTAGETTPIAGANPDPEATDAGAATGEAGEGARSESATSPPADEPPAGDDGSSGERDG